MHIFILFCPWVTLMTYISMDSSERGPIAAQTGFTDNIQETFQSQALGGS